jgi:hypothetical protein
MEKEDINSCLNCKTVLKADFEFCPKCGQETKADSSLKGLFTHFLSDYFTFDSKIIRSLQPLITKPGFLTLEYLKGKRADYIAPLRMFIFLSIIFFLLLGFSNPSNVHYTDAAALNDNFWNQFFENRLPKLFFVLLPIFALIISFLYRKQKRGMLTHFLFALHFHSSIFIIGIFYTLISYVFVAFSLQIVNLIFLVVFAIYLAFYLWRALRKVYLESRAKTSWKFIILALLYTSLLVVSTLFLLFLLSFNR